MTTTPKAWGFQSELEYKKGFLTGALMTDGHYGGFYPTPMILLRNRREDLPVLAQKVERFAKDVADKNRLVPFPVVLAYADGSFGIESVAVWHLTETLLSKHRREPLPPLMERSSRFYEGLIGAAIQSDGRVERSRILIRVIDRPAVVEFLQGVIKALGSGSVVIEDCVVIRGKNACGTFLSRLNNPELSDRYAILNSPRGQQGVIDGSVPVIHSQE